MDQVLVRHGLGLDVVLPRAVLDASPVAVHMGYYLVVEHHHVGQDVAQRYLPWIGMGYYQGVEQAVLVRVSERACLRLVLVQVLQLGLTFLALQQALVQVSALQPVLVLVPVYQRTRLLAQVQLLAQAQVLQPVLAAQALAQLFQSLVQLVSWPAVLEQAS